MSDLVGNPEDRIAARIRENRLSTDSYKVVLCTIKFSSLMKDLKVAEHLLATLKRIYDENMK